MGYGYVYGGFKTDSYDFSYVWPVRDAGLCGSSGNSAICLPKTGQTTIYYPGDDGDLQKGTSFPSPRFVDNADGTVGDKLTGLMWTKDANLPSGVTTWQEALNYVAGMNSGVYQNFGYTDWRLPSRKELRSPYDYSRYSPALPQGHPFIDMQSDFYWASTTYGFNTGYAWLVHMDYGYLDYEYKSQTGHCYVWPVRGGLCGQYGDLDGDTICNDNDSCPYDYNPKQEDLDNDGRGDACDYPPIPDTGQTKCYDNSGEITCPLSGDDFFGQDAQYGPNLHSYTKLGYGGVELPDNATEWIMVRDNVTGLIWESKTDDESIHDKDNVYDDWYQLQDNFIIPINGQQYAGFSDWRLPTIKELSTIVNSNIPSPGPVIEAVYFPNTQAGEYWSSTTDQSHDNDAFIVLFEDGAVRTNYEIRPHYVRAVRGGQLPSDYFNFINNGDGTVTDTSTGLMWQQGTAPSTYLWMEALAYCKNLTLAGYTDWRLPNRNELQSLVDYSIAVPGPTINTTYFPDTQSKNYWSATTGAGPMFYAWFISFNSGFADWNFKSNIHYYVRAVRGGLCGAIGDIDGDTICNDTDICPYDPYNDKDEDALCGNADNCPTTPNSSALGTCVKYIYGIIKGTGVTCTPGGTECPTEQSCQLEPGDINGNGIGDACECYADAATKDGKVNLTDLGKLKSEFGRTNCATVSCVADYNSDNKVNLTDLSILKSEFGKTNCPTP
jgi:hypothetical protein